MKNVHVIPTDKPSRLHLGNSRLVLCDLNYSSNTINSQNIYITSDEEIKDCCVLSTHTNEVYFLKGYYGIQPINKKIILTTDQDLIKIGVQAIDDEFLEWFVKNPSCEEVEVKKGKMKLNDDGEEYGFPDMSLYKIIIPKEEPKHPKVFSENGNELFFDEQGNLIKEETKQTVQEYEQQGLEKYAYELKETPEEAAERLYPFAFGGIGNAENDKKNHFIKGAKWQQEQFKNESEQLINELESLVNDNNLGESYRGGIIASIWRMKEWFEQYKKK